MKLTAKDIPPFTGRDNWTAPFEIAGGYSVRVRVEHDQDMRAPWEEHDGHGPVSDWRRKETKAAGERVLHYDGRLCLFYDFAAAVEIARRDGWDAPPYTGTRGERAARAVERDFMRLRDWCRGDWYWIAVCVEVSRDGAVLVADWCGGIESDSDYWREHAAKVAQGAIEQDKAARKAAAAAARKEARERAYWACRDVVTV